MEETKIFKILRFAAEREVFTGKELCNGTGLTWVEALNYSSSLWSGGVTKEGIFEREGGAYLGRATDTATVEDRYQITYAAMMNWLDYIELKEARHASLTAQRYATRSIWIAIVALVLSTAIGVVQVVSSWIVAAIQICVG